MKKLVKFVQIDVIVLDDGWFRRSITQQRHRVPDPILVLEVQVVLLSHRAQTTILGCRILYDSRRCAGFSQILLRNLD